MNKIRQLREKIGLSQKELAGELGVKPPTVSQWETDKKNPSLANYIKLSKIGGVSIYYFLEEPYRSDNNIFSEAELELLNKYRELNQKGREQVDNYIKFTYSNADFRKKESASTTA